MCIHSNALGTVKGIPQHHIRRLPSDARELHECFHRVWHSTMIMLQESLAAALNGLGFLTIKTSRLDILR
jgi:hypothetical protein